MQTLKQEMKRTHTNQHRLLMLLVIFSIPLVNSKPIRVNYDLAMIAYQLGDWPKSKIAMRHQPQDVLRHEIFGPAVSPIARQKPNEDFHLRMKHARNVGQNRCSCAKRQPRYANEDTSPEIISPYKMGHSLRPSLSRICFIPGLHIDNPIIIIIIIIIVHFIWIAAVFERQHPQWKTSAHTHTPTSKHQHVSDHIKQQSHANQNTYTQSLHLPHSPPKSLHLGIGAVLWHAMHGWSRENESISPLTSMLLWKMVFTRGLAVVRDVSLYTLLQDYLGLSRKGCTERGGTERT